MCFTIYSEVDHFSVDSWASLSAFWLRLSEKASSLGRRTDVSWVGFAPNNPDVLRPEGLDPHPQLVVAPLPLPQQEALWGTTLPYLLPRSTPRPQGLNLVSPSCSGLGQAERWKVWRKNGGVGLQAKP